MGAEIRDRWREVQAPANQGLTVCKSVEWDFEQMTAVRCSHVTGDHVLRHRLGDGAGLP